MYKRQDSTCPDGLAVFGTLVLGAHAYGVTELEGGGLEHIVKQLGYGDDPLKDVYKRQHAGYAPAGQDIVCAGASTVMQGLSLIHI